MTDLLDQIKEFELLCLQREHLFAYLTTVHQVPTTQKEII